MLTPSPKDEARRARVGKLLEQVGLQYTGEALFPNSRCVFVFFCVFWGGGDAGLYMYGIRDSQNWARWGGRTGVENEGLLIQMAPTSLSPLSIDPNNN